MLIEINDKNFGEQNYEYQIFINGRITDLKVKNKKIKLDDLREEDIVKILAKNIVFSSKYGVVFSFAYWIISLLAGFGESNVFGKPFDAVLKLESVKANYLTIKANKIWEKNPFIINDNNVFILKNEFISSKKYRRRWCLSVVMPINILIFLILMIFVLSGLVWSSSFARYLIIIPISCSISWNIYSYKVLKTLSSKEK